MMKKSPLIVLLISFLTINTISCNRNIGKNTNSDGEYTESVRKWAYILNPSVLTYEERLQELEWFEFVSTDLKGVKIRSTAENIETHYWESKFLAGAFEEITGIKVDHIIQKEGDIVLDIMDQVEHNIYSFDIYVNDSDLIGTHLRTGSILNLTEYMDGEGWQYTNPYLDLSDFLNLEMGQDYDGNQLQFPDQQFANLYWFRYDWFSRVDIKEMFYDQYGYELGVPVNWSAYEDIAEFFSNNKIDGKTVYGHLDYGKPSHSLGWRFTDAWFAMAGVGDSGLPNGLPVDEWGIRVENKIPVGSSVSRGGAVNSPAAVYALEKYLLWMKKFAPLESYEWEWTDAGTQVARGDIAQRIFQYTTWLSNEQFHSPGSPITDEMGNPKWRIAPSPHGKYWSDDMKIGYQDCGSWTIPKIVTGKKRAASWLWAQFCISKSVSLKKFLTGGTPVRKSTVFSDYLSDNIESYGGLIEFYRSSILKKWTDSGVNVPYYSGMSALWWQNIAEAIKEEVTPQKALDNLASQQDELMGSLDLLYYSPKLGIIREEEYWLNKEGSPKQKILEEEKPQTIPYESILKEWRN